MLELSADGPYDLRGTLFPLMNGPAGRDPTGWFDRGSAVRATHTPVGPAAWHAEVAGDRVRLRAWGDGAEWIHANARDLLGLSDPPVEPPVDASPEVKRCARRARGIRLPRSHRVVELLVPTVLAQKVSGKEAVRAHTSLVWRFSDRAPGPFERLWLPLSPAQLAGLPDWATEPLGVLARHRDVLRALGRLARRVEEADRMDLDAAVRRLTAVPGVGAWTAGSVLLNGMGHPDALPVGDLHLPALVAWNLAGERAADDRRMLELLEPYRGQRGRVVRWIAAGGVGHPPRRAPRPPVRPRPPGWRAAMRRPGQPPARW